MGISGNSIHERNLIAVLMDRLGIHQPRQRSRTELSGWAYEPDLWMRGGSACKAR